MLEDTRPPHWLTALGIVQCVTSTVLLPVALFADLPLGARVGTVAASAALLVVGVILTVLRLRVVLTDTGASISLRPFPSRPVHRGDVVRAEPVELTPSSTGGLGWRVTGPRARAVLLSFGPGVRLELVDGSRLVVRTDRPDELLAHLDA